MKNDTCLITIAYPGAKKYIKNFEKTILDQTDQNFDLVIILNKINTFNVNLNQKVKLFKINESVISARFTMLQIIRRLRYKKIIFIDIDDTMAKNRMKFLKKKLIAHKIVVNDFNLISKNKIIKNYIGKRIKNNSKIIQRNLRDYNFMGMSNTSLQANILKRFKIRRNNKIPIFDWFFWTLLLKSYDALFTNNTYTNYNVRKNSITFLPIRKNKANINQIRLIKKNHLQQLGKTIENFDKQYDISQIENIKFNKKYSFWWEI